MTVMPRSSVSKANVVGRRLLELGQYLAQLSRQVREAVARAIRETVAQLARDAVDRVLPQRLGGAHVFGERDSSEDGYDSWQDEQAEDAWTLPESTYDDQPEAESQSASAAAPVSRSALALALAAAGWWLRQRGSLWGACGVGLVAAAIGGVTRRLADDGFLLVQATHDLLAYRHAVAGCADL